MRRRHFLALSSLTALPITAGCVDRLDGVYDSEEPTPTPDELPESDFEASLNTTGDCYLDHEVELHQPIPNHPDGPVELTVTVENTTDAILYYYPSEYTVLHQVSSGQFHLFRGAIEAEYNEEARAWELTQPVPRIDQGVGEIEADVVIEDTYVLLPSADAGAEPVPDMVPFETSFRTSSEPLDTDEAKEVADECALVLELSVTGNE